jgi:hypothetical protein
VQKPNEKAAASPSLIIQSELSSPPDHLESDTDACSNGSNSKPYFCIAASAASLRAALSRRAYPATAKHSHSYAPVRHRRCPLTVGNNSACYRTRGHPQDLVTAICCGLRVGKLPSEALRVHPIDSSSYSTALHFFRLSSPLSPARPALCQMRGRVSLLTAPH